MDALKNRLDDLAHQAHVDVHDLVDSSRAAGTQMRRRRRFTIGAATLAAVAVVGGTAVGGAVLRAPDGSEPASTLVASTGPVAGVEFIPREGQHPLDLPSPHPFVYDAATANVELAPGAPEEVRIDGRMTSVIALTFLGELYPGRYVVEEESVLGSGEGDEVGDDGAVTGTGKLVEASSQMTILENGSPVRLSVLVQQRQRTPEGFDCDWLKGEGDCEIVPQDDGATVVVHTTRQLISPERPELDTTGITVDRYDPSTGLRLRIDTHPVDLTRDHTFLTREQVIALATADVWAPVVPIQWYLEGQKLEFVWSPSNNYDVLPEER